MFALEERQFAGPALVVQLTSLEQRRIQTEILQASMKGFWQSTLSAAETLGA